LLLKNIRNTLKRHDVTPLAIEHKRGRIYVRTENPLETAKRLTQVFGISSVSPARQTTSEKKEIAKTALEVAKVTIKNGSTFAVRCHRVGTHAYSSMDICKEIGKEILTKLKQRKLKVDLTNPQHTISIEIRDAEAYVYSENLQGPGGFPVGSQPRVVCLLSGGIDSPVACWFAMKRGCTILPVYFDNAPLTDEKTTAKALDQAKKLFEWSIGYPRRVYLVPHGRNLETFMQKAPRKLTCLLCKRMMYRIAERIAEKENAEGVVTGEAIGEQASQTLTNLRVLNEAARNYPVHRPLLGFDKTETEAIAKKIGTYEISIRKARGCTAAPNQPATGAKLEAVKKAEEKLDLEKMVEESIKASQIVTV
jgi:thiamine biosynthesis protein ThiI